MGGNKNYKCREIQRKIFQNGGIEKKSEKLIKNYGFFFDGRKFEEKNS